jgi:hypothetical protein
MTGSLPFLRKLEAVAILVAVGMLLIPWQGALHSRAVKAGFRTTALDLSLREQVGQTGFLAALSGFRSPLAAFLWIEAHTAWEKTEWGRMAALFGTVTTLQPHTLLYWDIASWHMAWNASAAALQDPHQKSQLLRERSSLQYREHGRDIIERGIANNPGSWLLRERLGILLRDKFGDHAGAADAFQQASALPGVPSYVHRMGAYEEAKVPGRESRAYDLLRRIYEQETAMHTPRMLSRLRDLEKVLNMPSDRRIPETTSGGASAPSR